MRYQFNLQPWREIERAEKKKRFITLTSVIAVIALALVGLNYYIEKSYIDEQNETKNALKTEVDALQAAKKNVESTKELIAEIDKQIGAIESLQNQRGTVLKLLDHLAKNTPINVFLNNVIFNGDEITLEGIAENDRGVADFMRALDASSLLNNVSLRSIESATSGNRYEVPEVTEIKSFSVFANLVISEGGDNEVR